jgi:multicomponent Na+:H+ antiporter subunit C
MGLLDVSLLVGFLFTVGVYLLLERHLLSVFFGLAILSNAANLFVLAMSGPPEGRTSPIVSQGGATTGLTAIAPGVDPLPQALILTAIVIGSGVLMFAVFLVYRLFIEHDGADIDIIDALPDDAVEGPRA